MHHIGQSAHELPALLGHVARNNDQWRKPAQGESLAIVRGPDAYVSPSWYAAKAEHGRVVPTWNYVAIHVRGPVTFFEEAERLRGIVTKLTEHHEAYSKKPWKVTDAQPDYVSGELKQIVGFEMPIVKIEGKWKMSQNRSDADRNSVMTHLLERDRLRDEEVSYEMKRSES